MKAFKVYKHPTLGYHSVKVGFSWPAFFCCTFILPSLTWMLSKKLWSYAELWLLMFLSLVALDAGSRHLYINAELCVIFNLAFAIGGFALWLVPAFYGNSWRMSNLEKRGYGYIDQAEAYTSEMATAIVAKPAGS